MVPVGDVYESRSGDNGRDVDDSNPAALMTLMSAKRTSVVPTRPSCTMRSRCRRTRRRRLVMIVAPMAPATRAPKKEKT